MIDSKTLHKQDHRVIHPLQHPDTHGSPVILESGQGYLEVRYGGLRPSPMAGPRTFRPCVLEGRGPTRPKV